RALLVNRHEQIALFDRAFDLFWQPHAPGILRDLGLDPVRQRQQQRKEIQWREDKSGQTGGNNHPSIDEPLLDKIFTYSDLEVLRQKDFAALDADELALVKRLMLQIDWNLEPRRTRRMAALPRGAQVDLRRTLRQNLRFGGEMVQLAHRERRVKRRPLVLICDISGSMERYARVLLQFIYVVTSRYDRVESFVFSTRLTRITRQLRSRNVEQALAEAAAAMPDWGGGTRIGEAIRRFNYDWARRVLGQGAVVLIISDGWDRGDIDLLGREMERLQRSCHRLIWLNPLLGGAGYEPLVRGIQAALPHVDDFLPVHNLVSLEQLAALLRG
ncbi:MAG: CoxE, partial [Chloroflexi bacterium]